VKKGQKHSIGREELQEGMKNGTRRMAGMDEEEGEGTSRNTRMIGK